MKRRPNIILITTDQQRFDTLSCNGNSAISTPALDALAKEGARLERAYVANPVCSPSRASMLTGRYPHVHGLTVNGKALPEQERTIAHILSEAGYDTAVIGKVHLGPTKSEDPETYLESRRMTAEDRAFFTTWHGPYYGFEEVHLSIGHSTGGHFGHYGLWLEEKFPQHRQHFADPERHALAPASGTPFGSLKWGLPPEAHSTVWTAEQACEYMDRYAGSDAEEQAPFFLWASFQDPHSPLACPAPYCDRNDPQQVKMPIPAPDDWNHYSPHFAAKYAGVTKGMPQHAGGFHFPGGGEGVDLSAITEPQTREMIAHYYGMVNLIDEQVGRMMEHLRQRGLEDDTIVIFTSDHGELLGDHGLWLKGPYHYEGLIRIPMLWRWPGHIPAGEVIDSLYSHVDLAPTLLDMVGEQRAAGMQGVSQRKVLEGLEALVRKEALCEFRVHHDPVALHAKTLIDERYKLTCYAGYEFGELFDLEEDPEERCNLWNDPQHQELKVKLQQQLLHMLIQLEDPLPEQVSNH